jgi:hypothetical protein
LIIQYPFSNIAKQNEVLLSFGFPNLFLFSLMVCCTFVAYPVRQWHEERETDISIASTIKENNIMKMKAITFIALIAILAIGCKGTTEEPKNPSATVSDVTITATSNTVGAKDVTITLKDDTFKENIGSGKTDYYFWFRNRPLVIANECGAVFTSKNAVSAGSNTITFTINGTVASVFKQPMNIVIPSTYLTSERDLTVTTNENAKWDIIPSGWNFVGNSSITKEALSDSLSMWTPRGLPTR